jgi:3-methyladenine DNA glycosylase/8-oxoguanine DNA glycosylase
MVRFLECAAALPGVRVLRILDEWECLVTFMGSANNNIKRNMAMVRDLCAAFPANSLGRDLYGDEHFAFPGVEQVASLSEAQLWELGWGYRSPRLFKLAREVQACGGAAWLRQLASAGGSEEEEEEEEGEARRALVQLTGVGRKVADCCLLFGYALDSVVPVDTHCLQLAQRLLLPPKDLGKPLSAGLYAGVVSRFHAEFGRARTGHAFMQMFAAELADFRKRVPPGGAPLVGSREEEEEEERVAVAVDAGKQQQQQQQAKLDLVSKPATDVCDGDQVSVGLAPGTPQRRSSRRGTRTTRAAAAELTPQKGRKRRRASAPAPTAYQ